MVDRTQMWASRYIYDRINEYCNEEGVRLRHFVDTALSRELSKRIRKQEERK